jgi:hypothetical protein
MRKIALFWLLCSLFTASVFAQTASSVTGRVTDSSGAIIGDCDVTLTDTSTNIPITTHSNNVGLYIFTNVAPGHYDLSVTKAGFNKAEVRAQEVIVGTSLTLNVVLEVGAITQTVEVVSTAGAELQTLNATMGSSISGDEVLQLPTINRDIASLVFLQPMTAPTFGMAEGNVTSGQVAGAMSDQNSYLLDGGNNSSEFDGDNGTYVGARSGVVPTPVESVEEFRVNTNNLSADFGTSGGGQVIITTKRGTNQFHGSAYDFFQSSDLASNDFFNNFDGISKPQSHYNRFGGSLGGPITNKEILGGKTYFFMNYEGERYPRSGPLVRIVPADTLRDGIIQERDATGNIIQYNLATSTACGPTGGVACDPRGIGISPVVSQIWNKYEPHCNLFVGQGDEGLNTCGYLSNLSYPLSTNFGVVRIDHDFGAKWRFNASYRYFGKDNPTTNQTDIGGLLPGDTLGQAASASAFPVSPRYLVAGLTGTLTPNLTNEFHVNYTRDQWQYLRAGATPQLPGLNGAIEIGGETSQPLVPVNVDTQDARNRLWDGHDYDFKDSISWLKGTHLFQMGGEFLYETWKFDRYDNVVGGLTQLVDDVSNSGVNFTPAFEPIPCSASTTTNCLPAGSIGSWTSLYADLTGIVDDTSVVVSRTGTNLTANPLGTPLHSNQTDPTYSAFFSDSWKVKPNLTVNYGLNYALQMPPTDKNGAQDILTDAAGNIITANNYFANVQRLALQGQVYNPTLGWTPVGDTGSKYPYKPFYGGFSPRLAVAWNPQVTGDGWLAKILGDKSTVIRAGFSRQFGRNLAAGLVSTSVLGDGFLQPVGCQNPNTAGVCTGTGQVTPATAFRIGVDGLNPPVGAITPTLQSPVTPGVNAPYATLVESLDENWKPSVTNQVDFSIQRQFKGNVVAEVGYVGSWTSNLYQGMDFGSVPYMMTQGGQTFAQAYANISNALLAGNTPAAQPFFETALGGTPYCNGFSSCTAAVVANESGNITTQAVTNLWSDLDTKFKFGPALTSTTQCFYCYAYTSNGSSNYQAMVATFQKRYAQGLTMQANFTYSHALGILSTNQSYTLDNASNVWNLNSDYGPQFFDRKFVINVLASYQLPFGKGHRLGANNAVVKRIVGGWTLSPIFTFGTGLPLQIITGSGQEYGQAYDANISDTAIPISGNASSYGNTVQKNVNPTGTIGVNGAYANGGDALNYFTNPSAVYNNFRPFILGEDTRSGGAGILRGPMRWNLDLGLTKDTRITERIGAQLYVQAFNVFNHTMFSNPNLNLQDPGDFGTVTGQYNAITLGGSDASTNYTRIIQIGLRLSF